MCAYHKVLADVYEKLKVDKGHMETLMRLQKATSTDEKFLIIEELERNGCFQRPDIQPQTPKNNDESSKYRTLGNKHFEKKTNAGYLAALKLYNESICYAKNDSEELGLGFANRSAVYFQLGLYDDCLINIRIAKKTAPARIMDKLNTREKMCIQQKCLTKKKTFGIIPELSFPANKGVPFLADCLKLEKNEQYGRHVITTTDLKPGDVVAVEEPFCSTLNQEFRYNRCENCLKENHYNLMPCKHCVSVMFCGDRCYEEAYQKFHKLECPIIDYFLKMLCRGSFLTLRTVTCAITSFDSVDELITFIDETKSQDLTVFNCNYKEKSHNTYVPVHFLYEQKNVGAEFAAFILLSLIYKPLLELTELKGKFKSTKAVTVLRELILHHMNRVPIRSAAIFFNGSVFGGYAEGVYAFRCLLNHSCAPNMMISSFDNKLVYTVLKPIKAGEQLFDNYDVHFRDYPLVERRQLLKNFRCQCKACELNYPMSSEVRSKNIPLLEVNPPSKEALKLCASYLNKYGRYYYPCQQLLFAEVEFGCQVLLLYKTEESMVKIYK